MAGYWLDRLHEEFVIPEDCDTSDEEKNRNLFNYLRTMRDAGLMEVEGEEEREAA